MKKLEIKVKYFDKEVKHLEKTENGDWIDLRAAEDVELKAGESTAIKLGIGMILPDGYEAHVLPRSSTFKKWGVIMTNSMGIIDNSYSGEEDEWHFPVYACRDTVIHKNDRICQFRIMSKMGHEEEININTVLHLNPVSRGGLGSTGSN